MDYKFNYEKENVRKLLEKFVKISSDYSRIIDFFPLNSNCAFPYFPRNMGYFDPCGEKKKKPSKAERDSNLGSSMY